MGTALAASQLKLWHLLVLSSFVYACTRPKKSGPDVGTEDPMPEPSEPLEPVKDLFVFAHDASLVPVALRAARRIEAATGIKVHVNEYGTIATAHPIFGSDFMCATGAQGRATLGGGIALARDCTQPLETVLLHEMIHQLGVGHHVLPRRGVMNEGKDDPLDTLTADDLEALCSVRVCSKFVPEA